MKNKKSKDLEKIDIESHFGLVHSCCQRFRGRGIDYDDLFQTGCMGLTKAAKKFDFGRGVKFSTYATPVILGELKGMFREGCSSLKISRKLKELSNKIKIECEKFINSYEREPTISELSNILNAEKDQILEALDATKQPISLNVSVNDENNDFEIPVEFDDEKLSSEISVRQIINTFEARDKNLIYLRFFRGITQSETAKSLGMSQVQVSRREKTLLKILREKLA